MQDHATRRLPRLAAACALLLTCAACAGAQPEAERPAGLDADMVARAVGSASQLRASGRRVWCVPFARELSGIQIRGNAGTWWRQAAEDYDRGREPEVGAVMAFSATGKMPMGHLAVVSRVLSDREIQIDHANWKRSQVSLGMKVVDVSANGDWTQVRVESEPGSLGRVYPVDGFISARDEGEQPATEVLSTKGSLPAIRPLARPERAAEAAAAPMRPMPRPESH